MTFAKSANLLVVFVQVDRVAVVVVGLHHCCHLHVDYLIMTLGFGDQICLIPQLQCDD